MTDVVGEPIDWSAVWLAGSRLKSMAISWKEDKIREEIALNGKSCQAHQSLILFGTNNSLATAAVAVEAAAVNKRR